MEGRENVIIPPHIAFNIMEAMERILTTTLETIMGFLKGTLRDRVA